jgi:hypothetical protein
MFLDTTSRVYRKERSGPSCQEPRSSGQNEGSWRCILRPPSSLGNSPGRRRLLGESAEFRRLVLRNSAERVADLVAVIQDALFHAVPQRLARLLIAGARDGVGATTHQALAAELGTAREVVSRILQRMERKAPLKSERSQIRIRDEALMRATARFER